MSEMQIPFPLKGIPLKPEMTGRVKVDDVLMQTLSALCGWDGEARRLLTCALNGSLQVTSPVAKAVINVLSDQDAYVLTLPDIPTSEVILRAYPNNIGKVFINIGIAATNNTGYPLFTGEWIKVSVNNLKTIQLWAEKNTDRVAVIYTD